MPLEPGTTIGKYRIMERLGRGGMAEVYKSWQPSLQRNVALKVLAPHLSGNANFITRFHQEAVSAANLKHTNIVIIHDVGAENGYQYIAMEYIEGVSLEKRIRAQGAVPPDQVVDIITQVGKALDYAHQRGFVHRDIKPANVLIARSGRAVLTDFGIVKVRLPVVSIIGYTNAGKSTLLNNLTRSQVKAENRLFATLDPSSRRMKFPRESEVIMARLSSVMGPLSKIIAWSMRDLMRNARLASASRLAMDPYYIIVQYITLL